MPEFSRHAAVAVLSAVVSLSIAACGGSGSKSPATTATTATSPSTSVQSKGGTSTVSSGPVRGTLHATNHAPRANRPWVYSVRVTDSAGQKLSGTVEIQFMYGDQVVGRDTPPTHPIRSGRWQDSLTFPATAIGMPLVFRAVIHTHMGSITLDWPVRVNA